MNVSRPFGDGEIHEVDESGDQLVELGVVEVRAGARRSGEEMWIISWQLRCRGATSGFGELIEDGDERFDLSAVGRTQGPGEAVDCLAPFAARGGTVPKEYRKSVPKATNDMRPHCRSGNNSSARTAV